MNIKQLLTSIATFAFALSASSANPNATVDQVRIYINPGHGTYTSNDRPMATIKHGAFNSSKVDTAGFFESNTNMQKAYGLLDKLKEYGVPYDPSKPITGKNQVNIRMSHATTGTSPALSTVAQEAKTMNADMFISIHSNANTGTGDNPSGHTNFNQLLFLHRGWDGIPYVDGSDEMAMACWNHAIKNEHMHFNWLDNPTVVYNDGKVYSGRKYYPTYKDEDGNPYWIKGDVTFQYGYTDPNNSGGYTRYYGVLNHEIPGFLVEGYDHTYRPAMHRAMNDDVCRHEGELYARGINDYFGWGKKDSYGKIYGIVRDQSVTMNNTYFSIIQNPTLDTNKYIDPVDNKQPLNNVIVSLYNSDGEEVDTYTTDDEWNGVYMFKKVAPGTYTIKHSLDGYKEVTKTVTVVANETNYIDINMRSYNEIVQGHFAYNLKLTKVNDINYSVSFHSTGDIENANLILTPKGTDEQVTIEIGAVTQGPNTVAIDASKLKANTEYSWAIALDNPASTGYKLIYSDNSVTYTSGSTLARVGVAIDKDQSSPNFGTIYTSTGYAQGIQRYNPDFTKNGGKILGSSFSSYYASPLGLTISNGKLYIGDLKDAHAGVWMYNPSAGTSVSNVFAGTISTGGQVKNGSTVTGGNVYALSMAGEGANRKLYVVSEDIPTANNSKTVLRYDLGTSDSWTKAPTQLSTKAVVLNTNCSMYATTKGCFISQTRYSGNNTSGAPAFVFIDENGTELFNSSVLSSTLNGTQGGGLAISSDLKTFAIVNGKAESSTADLSAIIYSVTWNGNTPSFTYQYSIPLSGTTEVGQMDFDHAGNLYVASRQQGLMVYAIKQPARQTITNATSTFSIKYPEVIYAIGDVNGHEWSTNEGVAFSHKGEGLYEGTINIDNADGGYGYFQFATMLGDNLNAYPRYGATTENQEIEKGNIYEITNEKGDDTQSWKCVEGECIIEVNLANNTMKILSLTGVEIINIDNIEIEYYNLQGVKVDNPTNGIYIKVQGTKATKVYVK